MKIILMILLVLSNFIYGIYTEQRKNKIKAINFKESRGTFLSNILSLLLFAFFLFLVITVRDVADYEQYEWIYYTKGSNIEIGYLYLQDVGYKLGMSFEGFRIAIFTISYFMIYVGLKKLNVNSNIVLAIYAIYPLTMDIIQLRNFEAVAVLIYALHFLMSETKKGKYIFALLIIFAGLLHNLSFVYLLLLLTDRKIKSKQRKRVVSILLSIMFLVVLGMKLMNSNTIIINILSMINRDKADFYTMRSINWGFILYFIMELGYIYTWKGIYDSRNVITEEHVNYVTKFYWMNLAILLSFPLLLININFYRIFRNLGLINYAAIQFIIGDKQIKSRRKLIILFVSTFILNFYVDIVRNIDSLFLMFFS